MQASDFGHLLPVEKAKEEQEFSDKKQNKTNKKIKNQIYTVSSLNYCSFAFRTWNTGIWN